MRTVLFDIWADKFGNQSAMDAFGVRQDFRSEADLDQSNLLQRKRKTLNGLIDFTEGRGGRIVYLEGGPYDGKYAYVHPNETRVFVIMDYEYMAPPVHKDTGIWSWHYDWFS